MSATADTTHVEELVKQLYRLGMVQRDIGRHALAELGSQGFNALAAIHLDGPLRVSEVATRLQVDLSVASRQAAALAVAGYVARRPDPEDRRAHRLTLTTAGERVLREAHRRMVDAFAHVLAGWAPADLQRLTQDIDRLRTDFTTAAATAEPDPAPTHPGGP